uniref:Uncharacterized protein n=1 Tax=Anguilla anguilla TaxID=7936 RepID=A0A0E9QTW0_ANGAN
MLQLQPHTAAGRMVENCLKDTGFDRDRAPNKHGKRLSDHSPCIINDLATCRP